MIHTHGLKKRYGATQALSDFSIDVPDGSVFALLGPNGAGKTTAIRILLNILRADSGKAEVLGRDSRKLGPAELARIGYVSENRELPDWMSVEAFLGYCKGFYPDWKDSEAESLARSFGLPMKTRLRSLSRGTRMKAALASVLAYRPKLLILDEPFSGLDVIVREHLLESIAERTPECTVLIATHDLSDIESFATHVGYLSEGRLLFAEEMDALTSRFREVEVVAETIPATLPPDWMNVRRASGVIRFAHGHFDAARFDEEMRQYGGVRDVTVRELPLRSIFIALAGGK
jgi:ABC-2 type transport system ATP-binding protein